MTRRQTIPEQWLILPELDDAALSAVRHLRRWTGVIVIGTPAAAQLRRLRRVAAARGLAVAVEGRGDAERVHNLPGLSAALLRRTPLVLLSPMFPTRSHPGWGA